MYQGEFGTATLALEMVFLAVLFAVVVNTRWSWPKKKNRKPPAHLNTPTPPQKETEPNSMKAGRALDEMDHQEGAANAEGTTTPKASGGAGIGKKSLWRLVGGCLLLAWASNSLLNPSPGFMSRDPDYKISYLVIGLLLAGIGAWLVFSYSAKRPKRALLILSVGWLLVVAAAVYTVQKSAETNKQLANSMRAFANDAQHYMEEGGVGTPPTFKPTGNATVDLFGRFMNDFYQEVGSVSAGMNRELNALDEKDVFDTSVLINKASLETEVRKRIQGQRIIEKYRKDLPLAFDAFRQRIASYNIPDEQKQNAMAAFENLRPDFSHRSEKIFNLLGNKEKTEFGLLYFMANSFNEYELKNGKLSFHSGMTRQRYVELVKTIDDTAKDIATARKEWLGDLHTNLQKLNQ